VVDYQEMYYKMARSMEDAINLLIVAQRECEELYLDSSEQNITPIKLVNTHIDET